MKPAFRHAAVACAFAFALVAGWRVVGDLIAERYAESEPERALRWRPNDPRAHLALAERQLAQGRLDEARANAAFVLQREPLQGAAFRILAEIADRQGRRQQAFEIYRIAERRAPRDLRVRAWLTQRYLEQGQYAQALVRIDRILRMSPLRARTINPLLVKLAEDPGFAGALADYLYGNPPWRRSVLEALRDPKTGNQAVAARIMEALQARGALSDEEYARWLDSLMLQGRWGEAYARWAGTAVKRGGRLPIVFNGDFEQEPSNAGFDWRLKRIPGVLLEFESAPGARGNTAYFRFLDRRVPRAGLEQPLLLSPGRYRLGIRMRAQALRSGLGLQWQVICVGPGGIVARSEPVEGTFGWRHADVEFEVPKTGCPGQFLRLVNPVPTGAGQQVVGEFWVDDITISRQ